MASSDLNEAIAAFDQVSYVDLNDFEFPDPFWTWPRPERGVCPWTVRDLAMCAMSARIRATPDWWTKLNDTTTLDRWRANELAGGSEPAAVDYVLAELERYVKLRDASSGIEVACFDNIWQSDMLVPNNNLAALRLFAGELEQQLLVEDMMRNQHLELLDPTWYPVVYGRTRSLVEDEVIMPPPRHPSDDHSMAISDRSEGTISQRFGWIATEYAIPALSNATITAKALGALNGVPSRAAIDISASSPASAAMSTLVSCFVPLFDRVLSDLVQNEDYGPPTRIPGWYNRPKDEEPAPDDEESPELYRAWQDARPIILPDIPVYHSQPGQESVGQLFNLRGRTAQVIPRIRKIVLSPGNPAYKLASGDCDRVICHCSEAEHDWSSLCEWHVEGMRNERIVACGLLVLDSKNVSPTRIEFRACISSPEEYEQGDSAGTNSVWGIRNYEARVQERGFVGLQTERSIAWPNIYQTRMAPFSLVDHSDTGHITLVSLLLVDQTVTIPSTRNVGCQQRDSVLAVLHELWSDSSGSAIKRIPRELFDVIIKEALDHTISAEAATEIRDQMRHEREEFVKAQNGHEGYFGTDFDMP